MSTKSENNHVKIYQVVNSLDAEYITNPTKVRKWKMCHATHARGSVWLLQHLAAPRCSRSLPLPFGTPGPGILS